MCIRDREQIESLGLLVYHIDHLRTEGYFSLPLKEFAPLKSLDLATSLWEQAFAHPNDREISKPSSPFEFYDQITIPAYSIGGWYDIFVGGTLPAFMANQQHGGKVLIGPWIHSNPDHVIGQMDFGLAAGGWVNLQFDITGLTQRWFDYWLKGIDNGITQEPPVKIFVMGENAWRDENEWPLARTQYMPLYLREDFALSLDAPRADEPADHYTYDPADPFGALSQDDAIIRDVRRKYNLTIGQPTAEAVKIQIGAAVDQASEMSMEIQGRDNVSGLPRTVTVTTGEVVEALAEPLAMIATVVKGVLGITPPELASDIIDRGIVLTGGGALLRGIDQYLTRETGVPVYRADNAMIAVAVGAGRALEDPALLRTIAQLD